MTATEPDLTTALCTRCGLCCDGSLFADVELASDGEASALELMGAEVDDDDDGPVLLQPCAALRHKRCTIYLHRPKCCRTFECKLLQNVRRGRITLEEAKVQIADALNKVEEIKKLLGPSGRKSRDLSLKERYLEALANEESEDSSTIPLLQRAMASLEFLTVKTFLGR